MREARINRLRERITELLDSLGDFLQSPRVLLCISPAAFVADNVEALAQSGRQFSLAR